MRFRILLAVVPVAVAACGKAGGGGSGSPTPTPSPPSPLQLLSVPADQLPAYYAPYSIPLHPELARPCARSITYRVVNPSVVTTLVTGVQMDGDGFSIAQDGCSGHALAHGWECGVQTCFSSTVPGTAPGTLHVSTSQWADAMLPETATVLPYTAGLDPSFGVNGAIAMPLADFEGIWATQSEWGGRAALVGTALVVPSFVGISPSEPTHNIGAITEIGPTGEFNSYMLSSQIPDPGPDALFITPTLAGDGYYASLGDAAYDTWRFVRYRLGGVRDPYFPLMNVTSSPRTGGFEFGPRALAVTTAGVPGGAERIIQGMGVDVLAFDHDGFADPSFGTNGVMAAPIWGAVYQVPSVMDARGRLTVGVYGGAARITTAGTMDPLFAWSGTATTLTFDADGSLLVVDHATVSRLDDTGAATPVLTTPEPIFAFAVDPHGNRLISSAPMFDVVAYSTSGAASPAAGFENVWQILCSTRVGCYAIGWTAGSDEFVEKLATP